MKLRRFHLLELEDSPHLPRFLRDLMTEYLHWVMDRLGPYDATGALIAAMLRRAGTERVVDLASGGAGPWPRLLPIVTAALGAVPHVTLTDLHPNLGAFARVERVSGGAIRGHRIPVDASDVPASLSGVRTMFTGLHHLEPAQVLALMRDLASRAQPFAAFEVTSRSLPGLIAIVASLLLVLVSAPFVKPFRLERLLLTWLVPILPVCIVWDGVVSALRTYTITELQAFAMEATTPGYVWSVGAAPGGWRPMAVSYIVGESASAFRNPNSAFDTEHGK